MRIRYSICINKDTIRAVRDTFHAVNGFLLIKNDRIMSTDRDFICEACFALSSLLRIQERYERWEDKHIMTKRLLSVLLSVCMVITLLPVSTKAEETNTLIGTSGENIPFEPLTETENTLLMTDSTTMEVENLAALQRAVNNAEGDLHIVLASGYSGIGTLDIYNRNKYNITLDLNGQTMDGGNNSAIGLDILGTLNIIDSGSSGKVTSIATRASTIYLVNGNIDVKGGTVENTASNVDTGMISAIYNGGNGNITVSGGTVRVSNEIEGSEAGTISNTNLGKVIITGGTVSVEASSGSAIYNARGPGLGINGGQVIISGGTVSAEGGADAIQNIYYGWVIISGGTVRANNGRAIYNDGYDYYGFGHHGSLTISGGTISANKGIAIYNNNIGRIKISGTTTVTSATEGRDFGTIYLKDGQSGIAMLEIKGGTIENVAETGNGIYNNGSGSVSVLDGITTITGGNMAMNLVPNLSNQFTYMISAIKKTDGVDPLEINRDDIDTKDEVQGYKYLKFEPMGIFQVGTTSYTTLKAAIDAVEDEGTIELLKDITLTATLESGSEKDYTLDLKGKTLDGVNNAAILHGGSGTLTITDTLSGGKITSANVSSSTIISRGDLAIGAVTVENTKVGATISSSGTLKVTDGTVIGAGTAIINYGQALISGGTIKNTGNGRAIINIEGCIEVTDGTVSTAGGIAIENYEYSTLNVSGGIVNGNGGIAIESSILGNITISDTALVTNESDYHPTIRLRRLREDELFIPNVVLKITGGTVENTSAGNAIQSLEYGYIEVTGGTVSSLEGIAICFQNDVFYINAQVLRLLGGIITIKGGAGIMTMDDLPDFDKYGGFKLTVSKTNTDGTDTLEKSKSDIDIDHYYKNIKFNNYKYVRFEPIYVPDEPTDLTATPGNGRMTLTWAAPDYDGGSPITSYKVSTDNGQSWTDIYSTSTTRTVNYLTNGETYTVLVRAVNEVGDGPVSASITVTLPVPTYTISGTIKDRNTNSGISGAVVQLKSGDSNIGSPIFTDSSGAYTITGIPEGTYSIEVSTEGYGSGSMKSFYIWSNIIGKDMTLPMPLTGNVTISGTPKYGQTLTATYDSGNNSGTLSYQWKRGGTYGTDIGMNSDTYTIVKDDIGQILTCVVTSDVLAEFISGSTSGIISKADGPTVTGVYAVSCTADDNNDGMLIGVTTTMEYKKFGETNYTAVTGSAISVTGSAISVTGSAITVSKSVITGLTSGDYQVRVGETDTHNPGPDSTFTVASFIPVPTYNISGTITGSDTGSGITGAIVQLKRGGSNIGSPVYADSRGAYTITGALAGTYTIEVSATGYDSGTISSFDISSEDISGKDLSLTKTITFIPVTDITLTNGAFVQAGSNLTLTGTITPGDATNRIITWSVENSNGTGAIITGNTFRATSSGISTVKATVANGSSASSEYSKSFTITVTAAPTPDPNPDPTPNPDLTPSPDPTPGPGPAPSPAPALGSTDKSQGTVEKDKQQEDGAPAANVNNSSDELKTSVLTYDEQEMVARGENAKIILKVTDISTSVSDEEKKLIKDKLAAENGASKNGTSENGVSDIPVLYIDLSLYKQVGSQEQTKVTETNGKISISIEVPENFWNTDITKNRSFYVLRIHNGEVTRLEGTYDAEKYLFTFETDRFSTYALTYQDTSRIQTYQDYHHLRLTAKADKTSQTLSYQRAANVDGYLIYGGKCGGEMKELVDLPANTTSYTVKNLKQGTNYKYQVKAYRMIDGEQVIIMTSKIVHSITESKKYGNPTKVTTNTSSVKLTAGKSKTVTGQVVLPKGKKLKEHTAVLRYESSNKEIATVNSKGKITAKTKGICYVYAYAQNGVYKRIKVTVE